MIFYKRRHVMQASRSWIPSWIPETHNSNLSKRPKCPISFIKTCLVFFRQSLILWFADHMTINQVIGMSRGKQEPIGSQFIWHHPHHDVIHFAFTKMADSQKYWQKYIRLLPSNYPFFWFDFSKAINLYWK